ncbi:MAG TPA: DsbA family oxidoreductase [Nitrospira sp.]|nr:DsbA family oxidoreductase [Nitrospira sp.]
MYSDVVCPWCYVGKRRLERALTSVKREARVTWRPFQLNPTMPLDGMDRQAYLETKFGSLETFKRMEAQLIAAGVGERIPFAFGKILRAPNTFAAHRLIWYAKRQGRQDATVESLFHAYFVGGRDIGDAKTLGEVACEAGLEPAEAETFLTSDAGGAEVKTEEAAGHRMGIRAVPHFVLNGTYAISGAQPPEIFLSVFRRVEADRVEKATHR